ncbi:hypothetical protein DFH06DRAFT_1119211 [Mycena polygramma]|nr:hypothetical protein DFH06DRAFT_1119211 [Mycena polygramma]
MAEMKGGKARKAEEQWRRGGKGRGNMIETPMIPNTAATLARDAIAQPMIGHCLAELPPSPELEFRCLNWIHRPISYVTLGRLLGIRRAPTLRALFCVVSSATLIYSTQPAQSRNRPVKSIFTIGALWKSHEEQGMTRIQESRPVREVGGRS